MFNFYIDGILIGRSSLEAGDPPMGGAEGRFYPNKALINFDKNSTTGIENYFGSEIYAKNWRDISLRAPDGTKLTPMDIVLTEFLEIEGELRFLITCVGIPHDEFKVHLRKHYDIYYSQ